MMRVGYGLRTLVFGLGIVMLALVPPAQAQEADAADSIDEPARFEVTRQALVNGRTLSYTVVAGETFLKSDDGVPEASIFSVAYTLDGVDDPRTRPLTFVFNGGPGSASLWLHMGVFGPRRIDVPSDGEGAGAPPYDIVDNPYSLLDVTDLVFIDPVGTGYSRALGDQNPEVYWGLHEDAASIADFIRLYITETGRWNSPRYVAGESYGTTRAAQLVHELTRSYNRVDLNGVLLISTILDFQHNRFRGGNIMPHVGFLPTYAATAWYHDKVENKPERLEDFLDEARAFAGNEYLLALYRGSRMDEAERAAVIERLSYFTGLSPVYLERTDLRIDAFRFMKEVLRDEGLSVGRFDSRYTGRDEDEAGERFDADPSAYGITGAYVTSILDYLTRELEVDMGRRYEVLSRQVNRAWEWGDDGTQRFVNTAPHLGRAMRENRDFRVFVANGYYDLATPFYPVETTMAANGIDPDRVTMAYYEAGHMMYVHEQSLRQLSEDMRLFIATGP